MSYEVRTDETGCTFYAVASPLGTINIVIGGVDRGAASMEGEVAVNRIPHQVSAVEWSKGWNGKWRAGSGYWGIRRVDTTYPQETTDNARRKILDAIEAAVVEVVEGLGPEVGKLGRLVELRSARNVHESEAKRLRSQAEDLIKQAALEEQAVEQLDTAIYCTNEEQPGQFEQSIQERFEHGAEHAREDIANLGGTPEGEETLGIWDLQKRAETKLREIEKRTPVAYIAHGGMVAYYRGYLKTCSDTVDAYWQGVRDAERAEAAVAATS